MAVAGDTLAAGRAQFWKARLDLASAMTDRAKDRGEVPSDVDAALALELVIAPLHFRALLTREPIGEHDITKLVDALLTGLAG